MQTPNRAGAPHAWNRTQSSRGPRKAQPPARRGLSKRSSRSCPHHSPSYGRGKRNEHSSISGPAGLFRSIRSVVRERKGGPVVRQNEYRSLVGRATSAHNPQSRRRPEETTESGSLLGRAPRAKLLRESFLAFDDVTDISECREVEGWLMLREQSGCLLHDMLLIGVVQSEFS